MKTVRYELSTRGGDSGEDIIEESKHSSIWISSRKKPMRSSSSFRYESLKAHGRIADVKSLHATCNQASGRSSRVESQRETSSG